MEGDDEPNRIPNGSPKTASSSRFSFRINSDTRLLKQILKNMKKLRTDVDYIKKLLDSRVQQKKNENFGVSRMPPPPRMIPQTYVPHIHLSSPMTQIDSATPPTNKKTKDKGEDKVANPRQIIRLLDIYVPMGASFLELLSTNYSALYTIHRLYIQQWTWEFWGALLGVHAQGWLNSWHLDLWTLLVMEKRPINARWRVMPTTLMRPNMDDNWSTIAAGLGKGRVAGPPWWTVDRLFIPINVINVSESHWFLVELDFTTWTVTIYDSAITCGYFKSFEAAGRFTRFAQNISRILDEIHYWDHFPAGQRRTDLMQFVEAPNVPQWEGSLGDGGVFVCMFMEMLASGVPVQLQLAPREAAMSFRYRMAKILWGSK